MNKALVWLGCFVAGALAGFIVGRGWDEPAAASRAALPEPAADASRAAAASTGAAAAPNAAATAPSSRQTVEVPLKTTEPNDMPSRLPGLIPMPKATPSPGYAPAIDSGVVNQVDAGEVFNKQISRPSTSDQPNQLGEAHRALEREPRDDGWAYTMEGELQNSMVNQTSTGAFKMEHVECRSTICEVRISGNGDQADAVRNWSDSLLKDPGNPHLFMNVSSTISSHERVDAIYIFRRPAKNP